MKRSALIIISLFYFLTPFAFAHEAYVLPSYQFIEGMTTISKNPFAPLMDTGHLLLSLIITVFVTISFGLVMLWSTTQIAQKIALSIHKFSAVGPFVIRIALAFSLFFAAGGNAFLGPEISLAILPYGQIIRPILVVLSFMIFVGIYVEIAAAVSLVIFMLTTAKFGIYLLTYTNYFAEFLALLLFGSRFLSFDQLFFGKKLWLKKLEKYTYLETPLIRILYGFAFIYAGFSVKFIHQNVTIAAYNQYHLEKIFHTTGAFIAAGAGMSEITIGLFILAGFFMRWTILISLVFITLSLFYFQELVWPHIMLYGISLSLLINASDRFTIDHYLIPWVSSLKKKLLEH